jgi:hypothetical protein
LYIQDSKRESKLAQELVNIREIYRLEKELELYQSITGRGRRYDEVHRSS